MIVERQLPNGECPPLPAPGNCHEFTMRKNQSPDEQHGSST